jgi:hypothetical protein
MRRSAFLAALRPAVCATAEDALRGTRWSTAGCPWIDRWFSYYEGRSAAQIERALRKYAPEASGAGAAAETIPLLARRVRRSIVTWSETGRLTDVPEGMLDALSGGGVLGVLGRAAAGLAFKQPDLFLRSFLHEVGHSTDPERKVDSFRLPAAEWMKLSDWRTSTAGSLATDLGIGDDAVNKLLATFKEQKRSSSNMTERWPIKVNGRMVTFYKYQAGTKEDPLSLSLDLFVHYDAKRDEQFVSRYARLDPMEDLAESFAVYLLEPGKTQKTLDVPSGGDNKWKYLTARYPDKLKPAAK